jgi:hypothetical protein
MKTALLTVHVQFFLFLGVTFSYAQKDNPSDFSYVLLASKNGTKRIYKPGIRVLIKYASDSAEKKVRGYFAGVQDGKFAVIRKREAMEPILVPVESIMLLRKIRPGQRIFYAAAGVTLISIGAAIIDKAGDSSGSAWAGAIIIPAIGAGVYFLCAVPISHLFERINEKRANRGWTFSIRQQK